MVNLLPQKKSEYPKGPIEIYLPASPGGQTDASARVIAEYMEKYLGSKLVIINQNGGGGAIAFDTVKNADADGYKLLYYHQALHTANVTGQIEDDITSLTPIGTFSSVDNVLVVSADAPWNTLEEFVADAKNKPGDLVYGGQIGGTTHFMGAMLGQRADIDIKILDVGNESDRLAALLGGQIHIATTSVGNAINYVESGDFKVLAALTDERPGMAPDFATAKEQGYDIVFPITHTLYGPKDLPAEIVEAWNKATEELAKDQAYLDGLAKTGQTHVLKNSKDAEEMSLKDLESIKELGAKLGF